MTTLLSSRATSKSNPTAIASAPEDKHVRWIWFLPKVCQHGTREAVREVSHDRHPARGERFHSRRCRWPEKKRAYSSQANSRPLLTDRNTLGNRAFTSLRRQKREELEMTMNDPNDDLTRRNMDTRPRVDETPRMDTRPAWVLPAIVGAVLVAGFLVFAMSGDRPSTATNPATETTGRSERAPAPPASPLPANPNATTPQPAPEAPRAQ